ncbi:hypothetical protein ABZV31_16185 [Streptomyces sp. NPDC005202]|uniref:hypothetical protein n=1 Tax=Streptomyces sp. NPDC005202 TaxID=3157021 RepID=UPI0033BF77D0
MNQDDQLRHALHENALVDAGIWVGAVSGLVGAALGAAGAIVPTTMAHRHQWSMARDQRRAELAKESIDTLTTEFVSLLNLAQRYPEEGAGEDVMLPFRREAHGHHLSTEDEYRVLRIAAFNVPGEALACLAPV